MSTVDHSEILSRFITSKHWIQRSDKTVKHAAFLPYNNEVSVFRTSFIYENEKWNIGNGIASRPNPPKTLRGRADITTGTATSLGLDVISSEPPPLHANLTNYPPEESKTALIALELASKAKFIEQS